MCSLSRNGFKKWKLFGATRSPMSYLPSSYKLSRQSCILKLKWSLGIIEIELRGSNDDMMMKKKNNICIVKNVSED